MGNQLDRITHLNYSELPTGDPSGLEKDELRVGVAYFFSDEEEEVDDRDRDRSPSDRGFSHKDRSPGGGEVEVEVEEEEVVVVEQQQEEEEVEEGGGGGGGEEEDEEEEEEEAVGEVEYSAFRSQECIFSKLRENEDLSVYPANALLAMCKPGDLLELVAQAQAPHWAVYERRGRVIHLHKGEIRSDSLLDVCAGRRGRIVNNRYRFRPLPADLVVQNAAGHLGLERGDICWADSESFAAWCRFGKREFKAGGEAHGGGGGGGGGGGSSSDQRYFLKVHVSGGGGGGAAAHTLVFRSLEDMMRERRRVDASGILEELSLVTAGKE